MLEVVAVATKGASKCDCPLQMAQLHAPKLAPDYGWQSFSVCFLCHGAAYKIEVVLGEQQLAVVW